MSEVAEAIIQRIDPVYLVFLVLFAVREWMGWQREKLLAEALSKLVDSMNGVKVTIAAITGKAS